MTSLKTLLVPAILFVAAAAQACDYYTPCYSNCYSGYSYNASYGSGYGNYTDSTPYKSCSYSNWTYDQSHGYYYCVCSYKPSAYSDYSKYVCIYNASYGNSVYYYNPTSKTYWGRYDAAAKGFSTLAAGDQKAVIADLPQDKFSAPAAQQVIPGSQANEQMPAPPALPTDNVATLPAA